MCARMWRAPPNTESVPEAPNRNDEKELALEVDYGKEKDADIASTTRVPATILLLPAELRLHIYSYLDLSGHVIGVSSHHTSPSQNQDATTQPSHALHFRVEAPNPRLPVRSSAPVLTLPLVCALIRDEVLPLIFGTNTFSFSDERYDYAIAFPILTSLYPTLAPFIKEIEWPLRQARDVQRFGPTLHLPDRSCVDEFAKMTGLQEVVLRYKATDVGGAKLSEGEVEEMGNTGYGEERAYRRVLAGRGVQVLLAREGVKVRWEKGRR
jgi:hypothetical protein